MSRLKMDLSYDPNNLSKASADHIPRLKTAQSSAAFTADEGDEKKYNNGSVRAKTKYTVNPMLNFDADENTAPAESLAMYFEQLSPRTAAAASKRPSILFDPFFSPSRIQSMKAHDLGQLGLPATGHHSASHTPNNHPADPLMPHELEISENNLEEIQHQHNQSLSQQHTPTVQFSQEVQMSIMSPSQQPQQPPQQSEPEIPLSPPPALSQINQNQSRTPRSTPRRTPSQKAFNFDPPNPPS